MLGLHQQYPEMPHVSLSQHHGHPSISPPPSTHHHQPPHELAHCVSSSEMMSNCGNSVSSSSPVNIPQFSYKSEQMLDALVANNSNGYSPTHANANLSPLPGLISATTSNNGGNGTENTSTAPKKEKSKKGVDNNATKKKKTR